MTQVWSATYSTLQRSGSIIKGYPFPVGDFIICDSGLAETHGGRKAFAPDVSSEQSAIFGDED
jgi:hypothetical protein